MIITKETDYALRILRVLLDGEKHSVAEMSETELIPTQFAYQILRKLSAGNLVQVSRGALGGCELSCDLDATSLYDLMGVASRSQDSSQPPRAPRLTRTKLPAESLRRIW